MYSIYPKKKLVTAVSVAALGVYSVLVVEGAVAATLGQRAVYDVQVLPAGHADEVGQCSSFLFGDVSASLPCLLNSAGGWGFTDNASSPTLVLSGGDGILGDGLAGIFQIETGIADGAGNNALNVLSYGMDPYLQTAGGTFKTTIHTDYSDPMTGSAPAPVGTVDAVGAMTLDLLGRHGVAGGYATMIGIQAWNIDDSLKTGVLETGLYESFTTGTDNNWDPVAAEGTVKDTLTGRDIGDANGDGTSWLFFTGVPYTEAFNVKFVLVSAKPVAVDDIVVGHPQNPITIDIAAELLVNDAHADPAETISLLNLSVTTVINSTVVDNLYGT